MKHSDVQFRGARRRVQVGDLLWYRSSRTAPKVACIVWRADNESFDVIPDPFPLDKET